MHLRNEYFESLKWEAVPLNEPDLGAIAYTATRLDIHAWRPHNPGAQALCCNRLASAFGRRPCGRSSTVFGSTPGLAPSAARQSGADLGWRLCARRNHTHIIIDSAGAQARGVALAGNSN